MSGAGSGPPLENNHLSINQERESSASGRQLIFAFGNQQTQQRGKKTKKLIKDMPKGAGGASFKCGSDKSGSERLCNFPLQTQ